MYSKVAPDSSSPPTPITDVVRYWGVVFAWMVIISTLSGEGFSAENTNRYLDPILRYFFPQLTPAGFLLAHTVIRKTAHFSEFFVLGCLSFWAARRGQSPRWRWQWAAQAMTLAIVYALVDEIHQLFVPNRTASYWDSVVDSIGALTSQVMIFARRRHERAVSTTNDAA